MELERCLLDREINKMLKELLQIPRNIIISIGPVGCLNVLYNESVRENKNEKLYIFLVNEIEMLSGEHINNLEKSLIEIINEKYKEIDSITIYKTCGDMLMCSDFNLLIKRIKKEYGIIVKVLERGPISKRKILPKERLKNLLTELKEELDQNEKIINIKKVKSKGKIQHYIPPIVSDYSGVCSVLYSPKILKIVISPGGCKTPIIYDEIRNINESIVYCSTMGEVEILLGDIDKLDEKIKNILIEHKEIDFIVIIKTVVPAIIGIDIESIAEKVEKETNLPVISLNTNGFSNYYSGVSLALKALGKKFMKENKKKKNSVNILGYTPLTFGKIEKLKPLFSIIKNLKLEIQSIFSHRLSLDAIEKSTCAELNLVLSHEGIELAEFMKKEYEIPYIIVNPVGRYGIEKIKEELGKYFNLEYKQNKQYKEIDERKVLIVSSPMMAENIRQTLKSDFGLTEIKAISFIRKSGKMKKAYQHKYIKEIEMIEEEEKLKLLEEKYNPDIIVGDLVYQRIFEGNKIFIPIIHHGYSTKLYMDFEYEYCGEKGYNYLKKFL